MSIADQGTTPTSRASFAIFTAAYDALLSP
jgi:hypothetical protein